MGILLLRRQENEYWGGAVVVSASLGSRPEPRGTETSFLSQSHLVTGPELSGGECKHGAKARYQEH